MADYHDDIARDLRDEIYDLNAEIERLRAEEEIVINHIMFLIDHSELWDDDGWSIQMPDGWRYHRG